MPPKKPIPSVAFLDGSISSEVARMVLVVLDRGDVGLEVISGVAIIIIARIAVDSEEEDVRILVLNDLIVELNL
jgi:hypothetical protein